MSHNKTLRCDLYSHVLLLVIPFLKSLIICHQEIFTVSAIYIQGFYFPGFNQLQIQSIVKIKICRVQKVKQICSTSTTILKAFKLYLQPFRQHAHYIRFYK